MGGQTGAGQGPEWQVELGRESSALDGVKGQGCGGPDEPLDQQPQTGLEVREEAWAGAGVGVKAGLCPSRPCSCQHRAHSGHTRGQVSPRRGEQAAGD